MTKKLTIRLVTVCTLVLCLLNINSVAQSQTEYSKEQHFVENKGQFVDQSGLSVDHVQFVLSSRGMKVALTKQGFSYHLLETQTEKAKVKSVEQHSELYRKADAIKFHRIDVEFLNRSPDYEVVLSSASKTRYNYYLSHTADIGVTNVREYGQVTYKNIYKGIDVQFIASDDEPSGFKYNLVVRDHGSLGKVQMKFSGAPMKHMNGTLVFETSLGTFQESIPASWIVTNENLEDRSHLVEANYEDLGRGVVGFNISDLSDYSDAIVIDPTPTFAWGSYNGGSFSDAFLEMIGYGTSMYAVGETQSSDFVVTAGAEQGTHGGGLLDHDSFLCSYNADGSINWATYYGGSDFDVPTGISAISGALIISGITRSPNQMAFNSAHLFSIPFPGGNNGFVASFTTGGIRVWSTYFGGNDETVVNGISIGSDDNFFYIAGTTSASTGIWQTPGPQVSIAGGSDGFVQKFDVLGQRIWGTYHGGPSDDEISAIARGGSNSLFVGGSTASLVDIATQGAFLTASDDGLLASYSTTGSLNWGTYFYTPIRTIGVSCENDLYFGGRVSFADNSSTEPDFTTPGAFQSTFGGFPGDGYLQRFTAQGTRIWGTYYGGSEDDVVTDIHVREASDVYIAGWTRSPNMISTPEAPQTNIGGVLTDGFYGLMNSSGQREWGSYYGGSEDDRLYCIAGMSDNYENFKNWFNVFIGGDTRSQSGISTDGTALNGSFFDGCIANIKPGIYTTHCRRSSNESNDIEDGRPEITVSPNPAHSHATIEGLSGSDGEVVRLFNLHGQELITIQSTTGTAIVPLEKLATGVYLIRVSSDTGVQSLHRLIKE